MRRDFGVQENMFFFAFVEPIFPELYVQEKIFLCIFYLWRIIFFMCRKKKFFYGLIFLWYAQNIFVDCLLYLWSLICPMQPKARAIVLTYSKLPNDPVCPSVVRSVRRSVCHNFLAENFISIILSEHLFTCFASDNHTCIIHICKLCVFKHLFHVISHKPLYILCPITLSNAEEEADVNLPLNFSQHTRDRLYHPQHWANSSFSCPSSDAVLVCMYVHSSSIRTILYPAANTLPPPPPSSLLSQQDISYGKNIFGMLNDI